MNITSNIMRKIKTNRANVYVILYIILIIVINFLTLNNIGHEFEGFMTGVDFQDPFQIILAPFIFAGILFFWLIASIAVLVPNVIIFTLLTLLSLFLKSGLYSFNIDDKENKVLWQLQELILFSIVVCMFGHLLSKLMLPELRQMLLFANIISIIVGISLRFLIQYFIFKYVSKKPEFSKKPKFGLLIVLGTPVALYVLITLIYNIMYFIKIK